MKKLFLLLLLFFSANVGAQQSKEVTISQLQEEKHPIDSSAHAAFYTQSVEMKYDFETDPRTVMLIAEYHFVIKIYDEKEESYGTFSIPFYEDGSTKEKVTHISGVTTNLLDDKIITTKLKRADIFEEKTSRHWSKKKFALPDVKKGSVIEVRYRLSSPFIYSTSKWFFQHFIPTDFSSLTIDVPSYFALTPVPSGFHPLSNSTEQIYNSNHGEYRNKYIAKNVPSIKKDKYVLNIDDYRSGVKYEIKEIQHPNLLVTHIAKEWDDIATVLNDALHFRKQIRKNIKDLKEIVNEAKGLGNEEKINFLYEYVRDNYSWNDIYGIGAYDGLKRVVKDKTGSIGELNLLLLNLLTKSGVTCYPLVLKSRRKGLLNTNYPTLSDLNYLLVYMPDGQDYYLLDATSKLTPIKELPIRALNTNGVIIKGDKAEIVNLKNRNKYSVQTLSNYTYNVASNQLIGTSKRIRKGYAATSYRRDHTTKESGEQEKNDDDLVDRQEDDIVKYDTNNEYELSKIENLEDVNKGITLYYNEKLNNNSTIVGDKIFIDACLDFGMKKNPFIDEVRPYPIFFNFNILNKTVASFEMPDGYSIETIPEPLNIALPNGKGSFNYEVKSMANKVLIYYILKITDATFYHDEYQSLRKFFDLISSKTNEKIIISKS